MAAELAVVGLVLILLYREYRRGVEMEAAVKERASLLERIQRPERIPPLDVLTGTGTPYEAPPEFDPEREPDDYDLVGTIQTHPGNEAE